MPARLSTKQITKREISSTRRSQDANRLVQADAVRQQAEKGSQTLRLSEQDIAKRQTDCQQFYCRSAANLDNYMTQMLQNVRNARATGMRGHYNSFHGKQFFLYPGVTINSQKFMQTSYSCTKILLQTAESHRHRLQSPFRHFPKREMPNLPILHTKQSPPMREASAGFVIGRINFPRHGNASPHREA